MSSTEPPSRIPPREGGHESKSAREELSSKGKVEKVREVDPDEETRKKKFLKYYKDEDSEDTEMQDKPSPIELYSQKPTPRSSTGPGSGGLGSSRSNFGDVENAIIPGPTNAPPPDVSNAGADEEEDSDDTSDALPQSDGFWEDIEMSDAPPPSNQFQETSNSSQKTFTTNQPAEDKDKPQTSTDGKKGHSKKGKHTEDMEPTQIIHKKGHEHVEKEVQAAPFKPTDEEKKTHHEKINQHKKKKGLQQHEEHRIAKEKRMKSTKHEEKEHASTASKELENEHIPKKHKEPPHKKKKTDKKDEIEEAPQTFMKPQEQEFFGREGDKKRDPKIIEIESPTHPPLPPQVQPIAEQAATQAAHYLSPNTVSLFYQMVGTIYIMQNKGVSRTEITLNNPSFSNSKFFGATITIEKYATAPDSFNIRLTGSNQAVVAFKENIPSLMNAFQNNTLPFRINRLDVEYSSDRPVFRRKEGEKRGDTSSDSGDLGEERK